MEWTGKILALLIAGLAGALMAVQGSMNSALGKAIGLLETTYVVHLVGLGLSVVLLLFLNIEALKLLPLWGKAQWYYYLGGILGVAIIYLVAKSIARVGAAPATTAIILCQVLSAALIDHTGMFGLEKHSFTWQKAVGTLLMTAGAWLILKE